jgi:hypothetical protein
MALASEPLTTDVPALPGGEPPAQPKPAEGEREGEGAGESVEPEGDGEDQEDDEPEPEVPEWVQVLASPGRLQLVATLEDQFCADILNQEECHASLARCLSAHFMQPYVHGLFSMDVPAALAEGGADVVGVQQTVQNLLNLLRPFTFY